MHGAVQRELLGAVPGQLQIVPPMGTCSGECNAECQGSCTAQANASCDIMCQAGGSVSCTTSGSVFNNCNVQCNAKGAIVCDGNFINAQDADCCANDLKSIVMIKGWSYAEASAGCDGGTCEAQAAAGAGGSVSCDMAPGAPPLSGGLLGLGLGAAVVSVVRRRRR